VKLEDLEEGDFDLIEMHRAIAMGDDYALFLSIIRREFAKD